MLALFFANLAKNPDGSPTFPVDLNLALFDFNPGFGISRLYPYHGQAQDSLAPPGGSLTIVDYAGPSRLNPLRTLMPPLLRRLEPHAMDLWHAPITSWLDAGANITIVQQQRFFGGLYQRITLKVL